MNYATAGGSADFGGNTCGNGIDFIQQTGTLTFPDGVASQTISIPLCLDAEVDPEETFSVALSNPGGGATLGSITNASVRIVQVDQTQLNFNHSGAYGREGEKVTVAVTRSPNQIGTATVDYATSSGSAVGGTSCAPGVDFIQQNGTLVFQPNDVTRTFQITTCGDNAREEIETATLTLSNPNGARLGSASTATLYIYDSAWRKQASFPTGQTLSEVHMISALEGWAVGSYGVIIHTRDGGVTWERQTSGTFEQLNAVYFLDAQHGWASGNADVYTTDGGATWQLGSRNQPFGTIRQVYFIDANRGFEVGDGGRAIMRTVDGGRNWLSQEVPYRIGFIKFVDPLNGLASSVDGILVTNDGGETWTPRPNATAADEWFDLQRGWRTDNRTVVGGVIQQKIEYTTDGGVTWNLASVPGGTFVQRFFFRDPLNGWAVGTKENVIRTSDGGQTWQTLRGGLNAPIAFDRVLEDIFMADLNRGVAVGNSGLLYTTNDGGVNWTLRQSGSGERVHKIVATDAWHAWAAMESGEILKTTDGGNFWKRGRFYIGASPADATIAGIAFPSEQNGWAAIRGRMGSPNVPSILKTTDSGNSWQPVTNAPAHNAYALDTFDGQTIVSVGFDGGGAPIVRSTDGGQTWTRLTFPGSSIIRDVDMVSPSVGYAAAGARILKSTDGFATWNVVLFVDNFFDVSFVDANNGWALGLDETRFTALYHTTDGGQNWTVQPMPLPSPFMPSMRRRSG